MHLASALRNTADALEAAGAAMSADSRTSRAVMRDALPDEVDSHGATDTPDLPSPQVQPYPQFWREARSAVGTGAAAFHLDRREQMLGIWAYAPPPRPVDPDEGFTTFLLSDFPDPPERHADLRKPALEVDTGSVTVHTVNAIEFKASIITVDRHWHVAWSPKY